VALFIKPQTGRAYRDTVRERFGSPGAVDVVSQDGADRLEAM